MKNSSTFLHVLSKKIVILQPISKKYFMESFHWLKELFISTDSVAHIVLLYAVVIAVGVYLGKIKIAGVSLGVTFVLFAGIVAGHIGFTAPTPILNFAQDFGLILFVFMIGMQVGPGFFESFGTQGIKLNGLAATAILLNILVMFACYYIFFDTGNKMNLPMMVGTLYGAVTNTPGLGAANEALGTVFGSNAPQIASAYACAYPLGVLGIIGAIILIRYICGVHLEQEEEELQQQEGTKTNKKPYKMHVEVTNQYLEGRTILQVHEFLNRDFVCSRIEHNGDITIANRNTQLHLGDKMLIVCAEADHEAIIAFIGPVVDIDLEQQQQEEPMISKGVLITNPKINGKTLASMHFSSVHGVNVTRVTRHGIDLFASASLPLQVGDKIRVVGPEEAVNRVAIRMGNSSNKLNAPNIATIFVGIFLGLIFGSFPLMIPGMPVPVKLGLAGGPLIIAILIGRYGYKIHLVTYTTTSANMMLREIGRWRRTVIRPHGLPHHHHPDSHRRSHCPHTLQVQLLHPGGNDSRYLHRPPCPRLLQQHLLQGGSRPGLFDGLSAGHVPAHLHRPDRRPLLLRITFRRQGH